MGRLTGRLFVGFTLALISFIAYSSQIFIVWPWYGRELSVELLTLLIPFNALVGMIFWNYYLCVVTDPGRVPSSWQPDIDGGEGYEVKKLTREPRYCRTCKVYKPPRAHHCSQCRRCVLRMDHHCPWVNNCVGHFNYGHFIRFLFYVDLACSYHIAMVTARVYNVSGARFWDEPTAQELIFIVLNYTFCVPVLMAVGGFSLYHFYAMSNNTTTIERWEKDKAATLVRRGKIREVKFPYNLGMRRNISSVLGRSPLFWCWPAAALGSGVSYEISDTDGIDAGSWPPEEPMLYPEDDPDHELVLPSTPWTYENDSFNPDLKPSSARRRVAPGRKRTEVQGAYSSLPPYHPDYQADGGTAYPAPSRTPYSSDDDYDDDADADFARGAMRVRRGSEGYEVKPVDREEMLRRFVQERTSESGRYQVYMPEPPSDSDSVDEDVPLEQSVVGPLESTIQ